MSTLLLAQGLFSEDGGPPLPYEQWKELAPRLLGLAAEPRAHILSNAKVDEGHWERADGYWSVTLAIEAAAGDKRRAEEFGRACAAEQERRKQGAVDEGAAVADGGAVAESETERPAAAEPESNPETANEGGATDPAPPPEMSVPTFLRSPAAPPPQPPPYEAPPPQPPPFAPASVDPPPQPPPFAPAVFVPSEVGATPRWVGALLLEPPAASPPAPSTSQVRSTVDVSTFALAAGLLAFPFAPDAKGSPLAEPQRPATPPPQSGATLDLTDLAAGSASSGPQAPKSRAETTLRAESLDRSADSPEGRDRRTHAGTVELDPTMLASLFGRKP